MPRLRSRTGRRFVRPLLAAGVCFAVAPATATAADEPVPALERRAMEELRVLDRRHRRAEPAAAPTARPAAPARPTPARLAPPAPAPVPHAAAAPAAVPAHTVERLPIRPPAATAVTPPPHGPRTAPHADSAAAAPPASAASPTWLERMVQPFRRSPRIEMAVRPRGPKADPAPVAAAGGPAELPSFAPSSTKAAENVAEKASSWADVAKADVPSAKAGDPFGEIRKAGVVADAAAANPAAGDALPNPFAEVAATPMPAAPTPADAAAPGPIPSDEQTRPLFAGPADDDAPPAGYSATVWGKLAQPSDGRAAAGVCLVTLRNQLALVEGSPEFASTYDGREYLFASAAAKATFEASPAKFVPAAAGRDAVLLASGTEADGSLRHATYYRSRLYVFGSADTLRTFESDPEKFAGAEE